MSAGYLFVLTPPGVLQGSPGRRSCCPVCQGRSVNQTPPSPPSLCLRTTRAAVGPTLLTATLCPSSSSAHSWSGPTKICLFRCVAVCCAFPLRFLPLCFLRCWTCLWLWLWITLNTWHEIPQSWVPITWMSLSESGGNMIDWRGEARSFISLWFEADLINIYVKDCIYPAEGSQRA